MPPTPHLKEYYLIFHLNSHGTTDIKPEMLSGVQTGNGTPHDKYNIRGIARALKQIRRHFHAKTTSAKLSYFIGVRSRDLFIDEAHTVLDIFYACCLVRFAAFLLLWTSISDLPTPKISELFSGKSMAQIFPIYLRI